MATRVQQVGVVEEILKHKEEAKGIALDSSGWRAGLVTLVLQELDAMIRDGAVFTTLEQRPTTDEIVEGIMRFRDNVLADVQAKKHLRVIAPKR